MFNRLRLRLTGLYLLAALAVIVLVSGGTYRLITTYLQSTTDLALQHKMAHEFEDRGLPLPTELVIADASWNADRTRLLPHVPTANDRGHAPPFPYHDAHRAEEEDFDGTLATIFVLPIGADGQVIAPEPSDAAFPPNRDAVTATQTSAYDWRTVTLSSGAQVRLLTYPVPAGHDITAVQLGRPLADQRLLVKQLLFVVLSLGAVSAVCVGLGSWWVAGQSLRPAYRAWDHQLTFIANASHELRTPLTLLRASTEVVLRELPAQSVDHRVMLNDVLAECDHMSKLVDDLLLLSRLDTHGLPLDLTRIDAEDLLQEVARQVGVVAAERSVQLNVIAAGDIAWADRTRIRQVLLILLDNALRHTPAGGTITLRSRTQGKHLELEVSDTGQGVAPEHLPHLWSRFYRPDAARSDGGSGLGLSIAQGLVTAHGGTIAMTSTLGSGTSVRIVLTATEPRHRGHHPVPQRWISSTLQPPQGDQSPASDIRSG